MEVVFGEKKLSAAELAEQHFQSVHHVMSRTCVLPRLPPGVCSQPERYTTVSVGRGGRRRVYSGERSEKGQEHFLMAHMDVKVWIKCTNTAPKIPFYSLFGISP